MLFNYSISIVGDDGLVENGYGTFTFEDFIAQFDKAISLGYHVVDTFVERYGYWVYIQKL